MIRWFIVPLMLLLILSAFVAVNTEVAQDLGLPTTNGYYLSLPLVMRPLVCSGEGEIISLLDPAQVCCPGLDTIEASEPTPGVYEWQREIWQYAPIAGMASVAWVRTFTNARLIAS